MSYINQIVEDGVTYDIAAKNLVNGFTQTTPGVNALDAAAGKSLNDSLANLSTDVSTNYATKTELSNRIVVETVSFGTYTVNSGANSPSFNVPEKSGYVLLSVTPVVTGSGYGRYSAIMNTGNYKSGSIYFYNHHTQAYTNTFSAIVAYIKA